MDERIRGMIEEELDDLLKPETINSMAELYEEFEPLVRAEKDVVFGHVVGHLLEYFVIQHILMKHRRPDSDELREFGDWMKRRAVLISSEIGKNMP